jgi:predicted ATPase/DNA-binding SARP family transcriptional activator
LQVRVGGKPVTGFATDKARALLAYLAVEADHPHRRDSLAGLLWPDQPQKKARQNLRQALSHLRQAIRDDDDAIPFLLVSREAIQLNLDCDHWLDVHEFAGLVQACEEHGHRRLETCLPCLRRMERIVELYRGGFLAQFFLSDSNVFEEWAVLRREWFHRETMEALSHLSNFHERRGDYKRAQQHARRQVTLEPWHEEAHRQLMRLLALHGKRSAALAQYETCRRALTEHLGVEPTGETAALYERIRADERLDPPAPPHNLPPSSTSFVGRERELAELADYLANPDCRMVTLVGPGGIGKTRLALQAAANQIGAFEDGVAYVSLAAVGLVESIVPTIADALGVPPPVSQSRARLLLDYLREREMLLVLDNVEHLLEGDNLLSEALQQSPGLIILLTSRERLNLREEWVYTVSGLTYPQDEEVAPEATHSAMALFEERARQSSQRFALEDQFPHVRRICQLVAGVPLGIELAAAWVATRSCEEIGQEIEHNLDVLATRLRNVPERHRSIRATFDHSWQLLPETEKELFARLSVFRGGFGHEAALQVAGASPPTLSALVDKSLVRYVSADRYDMHPLLRQYAAEKLAEKPQVQNEVEEKLVRYFGAFLQQQATRLKGSQQRQALAEIALEIENARLAFHLAISHDDAEQTEQSMESLYLFHNIQGRFQEGIDLFAQAMDRWGQDREGAGLFAKLQSRQATLYRRLGHYQETQVALQHSLETAERLGMQSEQVFCLVNLADVLRSQGRLEEALQLAQISLALARQIGNRWGVVRSLFIPGLIRFRAGHVDQAEAMLEESLALGRESNCQRLIMPPLNTLGDVACHRGDYAKAQAVFKECIALSRALGDQFNLAMHLNNLGTVLHVLEEYAEAQTHYEESLRICRQIGDLSGQAIALSNLGEVAHALDAHREAMTYYQKALAIGRDIEDQWAVMACLNNLGEGACALEDYDQASAYLAEALAITFETQTLTVLFNVLVNLAVLFAKQGHAERTATLLGLARDHPASEQATQEQAQRLLNEMGLAPPEGEPRPLDSVVTEILAELAPPATAQTSP